MDTNTIDSQLAYLEETKSLLKDAIINKGQNIQDTDTFRSYANKVDQISTLASETADADANSDNIEQGKTAYVNGEKIVGSLAKYSTSMALTQSADSFNLWGNGETYTYAGIQNITGKAIFEQDTSLFVPYNDVCEKYNIKPENIMSGLTVFGMTGTATTDATATANDILEGKTAYVNGVKVEGNIVKIMNIDSPCDAVTNGENVIYISKDNITSGYYTETNNIRLNVSYEQIVEAINLLPSQIVEGNTILGIAGTGKTSEDLQAQLDAQDELIASQQAQIEELKSLLADKASNITNESIETVNNVLGNGEV